MLITCIIYSQYITIAGAGPYYIHVLMTLNHYTSLLENNDQKIRGINRSRIIELLIGFLDDLAEIEAIVPICKKCITWANKKLYALDEIGVHELDNIQRSTDIVQIVAGTTGAIAGTAGALIAIAGTGGWGVIPYVVFASAAATMGADMNRQGQHYQQKN